MSGSAQRAPLDDIPRVETSTAYSMAEPTFRSRRQQAHRRAARPIAERVKRTGTHATMFCFDGAEAPAMQALGYRLCTITSDQNLLRAAARSGLVTRALDSLQKRRPALEKSLGTPICTMIVKPPAESNSQRPSLAKRAFAGPTG